MRKRITYYFCDNCEGEFIPNETGNYYYKGKDFCSNECRENYKDEESER